MSELPHWIFFEEDWHLVPRVGDKLVVIEINNDATDMASSDKVIGVVLERWSNLRPTPDWSTAPEWANWWAIDPNGYVCWFQEEPVMSMTVTYCGWVAKTFHGVQQGAALWNRELDIPLGIDWRLLKQRRPK